MHAVDGQEGFEFFGRGVEYQVLEDRSEVGKAARLVVADLLTRALKMLEEPGEIK